MSKQKPDSTQPSEVDVVNTSRRKLTSAALAGPVILGTLVSKQALGGVPYHCTISGQISGTGSVRPQETVVCSSLGRSPGFWKNHWTCWGIDGVVNGVTVAGPFRPFNAIFTGSPITGRMGDILENCDCCKDDLARAAIASYLNAKHFLNSYPLTTDQVIWLYNNASSGPVGNYPSLKGYFESLYDNSDDWPAGFGSNTCPSDPDGFTCDTPTPGSATPSTAGGSLTGTLSAGNARNINDITSIKLVQGSNQITCTTTSNTYSCAAAPGSYTLVVVFPNPGSNNSQNAVCINGTKYTTSPLSLSISVGTLPAIKVIKGGDSCL